MLRFEKSSYTEVVRPALAKAGRDPVRVENPAHPGTPDISYVDGWLELKAIPKRPARHDSIVRVDHFTPQQRTWLIRRWRAGGRAFLLLRLEDTWMLFDGETAARHLSKVDEAALRRVALFSTEGFWTELFVPLLDLRRKD